MKNTKNFTLTAMFLAIMILLAVTPLRIYSDWADQRNNDAYPCHRRFNYFRSSARCLSRWHIWFDQSDSQYVHTNTVVFCFHRLFR